MNQADFRKVATRSGSIFVPHDVDVDVPFAACSSSSDNTLIGTFTFRVVLGGHENPYQICDDGFFAVAVFRSARRVP